jgi:DNA ligase-1
MKTFPTLYKKSGRGALQQWTISAGQKMGGEGTIVVEHGQVGGKLQCSVDVVTEGKNPGKKNETTPIQQAANEAEAKWRKKQEREGYVEDLARAEAGESDKGGTPPMLAKVYGEVKDKYHAFPAHGQRKLNGVRCLVNIDDGVVSLWSRKGKPIVGVPHVQAAYERLFASVKGEFTIDGELYRHGWSLQKISGYVRKEGTKPGFEEILHHVYDVPVMYGRGMERLWRGREEDHRDLFTEIIGDQPEIKKVETIELRDETHMRQVEDSFVAEHYEGLMYRNLDTPYESDSRSYGLLKVKRWKDLEFPIIGVYEGRGKFAGLAMFTCRTVEGRDDGAPQEFDCTAPGNFSDREEFLRRGDAMIGQQLTVKFFEWTDDKKPSHGVGMAVRDYE